MAIDSIFSFNITNLVGKTRSMWIAPLLCYLFLVSSRNLSNRSSSVKISSKFEEIYFISYAEIILSIFTQHGFNDACH